MSSSQHFFRCCLVKSHLVTGVETVDADMEDVFAENSFTELETLDPFLMSLNDRKLSPRDYALELVKAGLG